MGESGDPPAGTPEGGPDGGEDEYRSVVFDESFVRAARLQEFSARERMTDHARAVRRRPALHRGLSRQALLLVVLIALAFGTAIYMGIRHPYPAPQAKRPQPLRMTVIPLAPQGSVPGSTRVADLYAHSPAARFPAGAEGVGLPAVRRTAHFSNSQVRAALTTAREYLIASSLDPDTLTGGSPGAVRLLLDPAQHGQFDRSFAHPAADERHAPTGWLVRFDRARAALADERARVRGTLRAAETDRNALEVTSDHTFVYALRPPPARTAPRHRCSPSGASCGSASTATTCACHRAELLVSAARAGPLSCADETASRLRPLLAGQRAKAGGPAATDPYETGKATAVCGSLAASAQPSP